MYKIFCFVVLLTFGFSCKAGIIDYRECRRKYRTSDFLIGYFTKNSVVAPRDNDMAIINFVDVVEPPYCNEMPCDVEKGTNFTMAIDWTSENVYSQELYLTIYAYVDGVTVKFPGDAPNTDACKDLYCAQHECGLSAPNAGECPIFPDETFLSTVMMLVLNMHPTGLITVQWAFTDPATDVLILCFELDINILL